MKALVEGIDDVSRELNKFDKGLGREVLLRRGRLFWELKRNYCYQKGQEDRVMKELRAAQDSQKNKPGFEDRVTKAN